MLLETDIYRNAGGLPDVSQVGPLPEGVGKVSALAGIHSGQDYLTALKAATTPTPQKERPTDPLDSLPVNAAQQKLDSQRAEKRRLSAMLRAAADGSAGQPPSPGPEPFMPYTQAPEAPGGPGNSLFPDASDDTGVGENILLTEPSPQWLSPLMPEEQRATVPPPIDWSQILK